MCPTTAGGCWTSALLRPRSFLRSFRLGGKLIILVDGGIRSGVDVFKALALGADGVLIARPFVNMVYGGGAEGVRLYVEKLCAELADTMAMCGAATLKDIDRSMIR